MIKRNDKVLIWDNNKPYIGIVHRTDDYGRIFVRFEDDKPTPHNPYTIWPDTWARGKLYPIDKVQKWPIRLESLPIIEVNDFNIDFCEDVLTRSDYKVCPIDYPDYYQGIEGEIGCDSRFRYVLSEKEPTRPRMGPVPTEIQIFTGLSSFLKDMRTYFYTANDLSVGETLFSIIKNLPQSLNALDSIKPEHDILYLYNRKIRLDKEMIRSGYRFHGIIK